MGARHTAPQIQGLRPFTLASRTVHISTKAKDMISKNDGIPEVLRPSHPELYAISLISDAGISLIEYTPFLVVSTTDITDKRHKTA
jgi:hypothetical protein